jgi:hypothetical protein
LPDKLDMVFIVHGPYLWLRSIFEKHLRLCLKTSSNIGYGTLLLKYICRSSLEPKMGHLTANNGSFPQQRTTRVGVLTD